MSVSSVSVKWSRHKRDPGQTWRFWRDEGVGFTCYRAAWFYVTVERDVPTAAMCDEDVRTAPGD